jgi:hypothetical protein
MHGISMVIYVSGKIDQNLILQGNDSWKKQGGENVV